MKICLINNLYPPYAVGGAEKVVEKRARDLAAQGEEVRIITWRPWQGWGSWRPEKGAQDEIIIYRYWAPNIFSYKNLSRHNFFWKLCWHFIDIFNFASARIIRRILEREKPDIVETHNLMGIGVIARKRQRGANEAIPMKQGIASPLDKLGARNDSGKWVHYLHDVQLVEPSGVLPWNHEKDKLYQKIYSRLTRWIMGEPDEVVCLSGFMRDFYQSRGFFQGAKWSVAEISNFQFPISKQIPNSNVKFLFVGSLMEHKGIRVLMRAWDAICHSRPVSRYGVNSSGNPEIVVSLHIVGDGVLFDEVKKWAENHPNVTVHGRLEGEDLENIYQQCDVLIFPSICLENKPTVIIEALERGLLVIAAATGGVREFVREKENAWLFEPGNVSQLLKRMKRFV